jgi:hypothetical protein
MQEQRSILSLRWVQLVIVRSEITLTPTRQEIITFCRTMTTAVNSRPRHSTNHERAHHYEVHQQQGHSSMRTCCCRCTSYPAPGRDSAHCDMRQSQHSARNKTAVQLHSQPSATNKHAVQLQSARVAFSATGRHEGNKAINNV